MAVHLDHATDIEHLELSVGLAEQGIKFDSIMVDASHADVSQAERLLAEGEDGGGKHCSCETLDQTLRCRRCGHRS
jgi:hypothetical protein